MVLFLPVLPRPSKESLKEAGMKKHTPHSVQRPQIPPEPSLPTTFSLEDFPPQLIGPVLDMSDESMRDASAGFAVLPLMAEGIVNAVHPLRTPSQAHSYSTLNSCSSTGTLSPFCGSMRKGSVLSAIQSDEFEFGWALL
jgi:hypothetical protein